MRAVLVQYAVALNAPSLSRRAAVVESDELCPAAATGTTKHRSYNIAKKSRFFVMNMIVMITPVIYISDIL